MTIRPSRVAEPADGSLDVTLDLLAERLDGAGQLGAAATVGPEHLEVGQCHLVPFVETRASCSGVLIRSTAVAAFAGLHAA